MKDASNRHLGDWLKHYTMLIPTSNAGFQASQLSQDVRDFIYHHITVCEKFRGFSQEEIKLADYSAKFKRNNRGTNMRHY